MIVKELVTSGVEGAKRERSETREPVVFARRPGGRAELPVIARQRGRGRGLPAWPRARNGSGRGNE